LDWLLSQSDLLASLDVLAGGQIAQRAVRLAQIVVVLPSRAEILLLPSSIDKACLALRHSSHNLPRTTRCACLMKAVRPDEIELWRR
jgi:hypothetical protein